MAGYLFQKTLHSTAGSYFIGNALKYLHVLCIIVFTGLFIANYYYVGTALKTNKNSDNVLIAYSLRFSFFIDIVLGFVLIAIPASCGILISMLKLPLSLPWLISAYLLCALVTLFFLLILKIKWINAKIMKSTSAYEKHDFQYSLVFHILNSLVLICLFVTLHDAIFQAALFAHNPGIRASYNMSGWLKVMHVASACVLFGTGAGTALYMFMVNQTKNVSLIAAATKRVVVADGLFTTSSGVIQAFTGLCMIYLKHYSLTQLWVIGSIIGYLLAGCCWVPVVYLQMQCRDIAVCCVEKNQALPPSYQRYFYQWCVLGIPAFLALLGVIYLMTEKPTW